MNRPIIAVATGLAVFWVLAGLATCALLGGCATTPTACPKPIIQTKEVLVPTPVPCKALTDLGAEPSYLDTDAALAGAPDVFEQARLLLKGRLMRGQRLAAYGVAKVACVF